MAMDCTFCNYETNHSTKNDKEKNQYVKHTVLQSKYLYIKFDTNYTLYIG